jgi:serine/threonine protein kinase
MTERLGQQLGNYRLIRLLGSSSEADVYLSEHVLEQTLAAIKVLRAKLTAHQLSMFRAETDILCQLETSQHRASSGCGPGT